MSPTDLEGSGVFATIWWIVAAISVIGAVLVVHLRDVLRASLALITSFLAIAGLFVMLNAEFLAAVQVLIYAGAISILIIFAAVMTRDVQQANRSNNLKFAGLFLSASILAIITLVVLNTDWNLLRNAELAVETQSLAADVFGNSTPWLAGLLLRDFALPFEAASVLLLAAIIGAIVLVRDQEGES